LPAVLAIGAAVALATRWSFRAQPEPPEARESTALVDTKVSPDATTGDSTNPVARLSTGGGKDGPQISLVQKSIELAALYQAIGDYASAKAVYERALKIQERELDPDDLQLAHTLSRLGWVLETLRSYSEAKALLTRALAIYEKKLGPEHPLTSNTLASLGSIHRHLGAHAEAALLLKRAEALRKPNHTLAPRPAMESLNLLSASEALQDGAPEFTIEAKLYRHGSREEPLSEGLRVAPGDRLSLKLRASQDLFVYVINEDQRGESFLLSPLPGQELPQPLPANTVHHLPGRMAGREVLWQVTSAGGREFFFVVASRRRLREFERELQSVPRAQPGALRLAVPLSDGLRRALRGIGGLVAKERAAGAPPPSGELFRMAASLGAEAETVRGIWIRRLTLDNP
jgi:tetratricopeptide (TPR) repeat protein